MDEYGANIDFLDMLDDFSMNRPQDFQLISVHSLQEPPHTHNNRTLMEDSNTKKELPTSVENVSTNNPILSFKENQVVLEKGNIQFQWEVRNLRQSIRQGTKNDTVELNINFKTIIFTHFKNLLQDNELTPEESRRVLDFGKRSPSFRSLLAFCRREQGCQGIARHCLQFVESSKIINRILSSRCQFSTKKQMIKFVEVLRNNLTGNGKVKKWKQLDFK